jgi:hypothetical protein
MVLIILSSHGAVRLIQANRAVMDCRSIALTILDGPIGTASTVKMLRSIMIKGVEALTAETMLAASAAGLVNEVIAALGRDLMEAAHFHFKSAWIASRPACAHYSSWSSVPPLTPIAPIHAPPAVRIGKPPPNDEIVPNSAPALLRSLKRVLLALEYETKSALFGPRCRSSTKWCQTNKN